jgi:zinc protease
LTTVVVVGDVQPDVVRQEFTDAFGGWTATGPKPEAKLPSVPLPLPVRKYVDAPDQRDVAVQLGTVALARSNPDYYGFDLMNNLLGDGTFDSRLMNEARQKRGLVYDISSSLNANRDRGTFTIEFRAIPQKVDPTLAVIKTQLVRLQNEPVPLSELNRQRTKLVAKAVIAEGSTYAIAGDLANIAENDLPIDYYATLPERYAAISPQDILRIAKTYLHPDHLVEVETGPPKASVK